MTELTVTLPDAIVNLDEIYTEHMSGNTIVDETEKWQDALASIDQSLYDIGDVVKVLDEEYIAVTRVIDEETRQGWLKSLEEIQKKMDKDLPAQQKKLEAEYQQTMAAMQSNTEQWQQQLEMIESQMLATDIPEEIQALQEQWQLTQESMAADSQMFQERLDEIAAQLGVEIPSELETLQQEYDYIMSLMCDSTQQLYMDANGVIYTLQQILRLEGQMQVNSGGYGKYGVYTEEEKQQMTADFYAMKTLLDQNRATILSDAGQMASFYADFQRLVVIDEVQAQYDYWLQSYGQWNQHLQKGHIWNESTNSWIIPESEPDITAASGYRTLLDRPTHIWMDGKHILAGESGPEWFTISPLDPGTEPAAEGPFLSMYEPEPESLYSPYTMPVTPEPREAGETGEPRQIKEKDEPGKNSTRGGDINIYVTVHNTAGTDVVAEVVKGIKMNRHDIQGAIRSI